MTEIEREKNLNSRRVFEVSIAGVPLRLKSSHDEPLVNDLVNLVQSRVSEVLPHVKSGSLQTAALLAALNIAEELVLLKKQAHQELDRLEQKADRVIAGLESSRIPKAGVTPSGN